MIVMKFGGSSLKDTHCIRRAVDIVAQHRDEQPVVVVSAIGRTTQALVRLGHTALTEGFPAAELLLDDLLQDHRTLLGDLHVDPQPAAEIESGIAQLGENIARLLEGVSLLRELTPRTEDAIIGQGERFSTLLFSAAASSAGLDVERVDATKVIITDDRFRAARPDRDEIVTRARTAFLPLLETRRIPVIEGFIGATPEGTPTTMGFEASDYTASLLGAALDASEIQIWTDVPGILTTGRSGVEGVLSVAELSFDEAAELSFFGAKVLHPRTIDPAADRNIPVRILHSRDPEGTGTKIFGAPLRTGGAVKSIAVEKGVLLVRADSPRPVPAHRTLGFLGKTLDRHEISPQLLSVSGHRMVFAVSGSRNLHTMLGELGGRLEVSRKEDCAIVSLVGADTGTAPAVLTRATEVMGDIPILMTAQGVSDTSLSLVVSEADVQEVVERLHGAFFGEGFPDGTSAREGEEAYP